MALAAACLAPASSAAVTNPYTAGEVCGGAFERIDSFATSNGVARTVVMRNPSNGQHCAVTLKTSLIGTATAVGVGIGRYHTDVFSSVDYGLYKYYAGPVYRGGCVFVGGTASLFDTGWLYRAPYPSLAACP